MRSQNSQQAPQKRAGAQRRTDEIPRRRSASAAGVRSLEVLSQSSASPSLPDEPALRHSRRVLELIFGPPSSRPFDVSWWTGTVDRGRTPSPPFTFVVARPGALRRMLLPPSELAIVESYLGGDIDILGDMEAAATLGDVIAEHVRRPRTLAALMRELLALPTHHNDGQQTGPEAARAARAGPTVEHAGKLHEPARDAAAVRYHYDVGNDFYALWLDPRMVYSCAYFRSPDDTLEQAQLAKLDHVCRKLRLRPGHRFLDVGCGWGALIMHAAAEYGVNAVGITLSTRQAELARERIAAAGLGDRCRVEVADYRAPLAGAPFDRVASVGMVEHVGQQRLPGYFAAIKRAMVPGGLLLNHGIVNTTLARSPSIAARVEHRLWRRGAFVDQYVFPDGVLAPLHAVIEAAEVEGFETRDAESLREHYTRTLRRWVTRLDAHWTDARQTTDERTARTWRLYMAASAHGFDSGRLNVVQTLFALPDHGHSDIPPTRDDIYAERSG